MIPDDLLHWILPRADPCDVALFSSKYLCKVQCFAVNFVVFFLFLNLITSLFIFVPQTERKYFKLKVQNSFVIKWTIIMVEPGKRVIIISKFIWCRQQSKCRWKKKNEKKWKERWRKKKQANLHREWIRWIDQQFQIKHISSCTVNGMSSWDRLFAAAAMHTE